jgi:hypothetical protein
MPVCLLNVIYAYLLNILDEMNDMHTWLFKLYITRKLSKSTNYTNYTTSEEQASFFLLDSLFDPKIVWIPCILDWRDYKVFNLSI